MNLLDLIILLAALAYGVGGFRNGAVVGALSMVGFFGGAAVGAQLAEPLGSRLADGRAQVPVAIVCVLMLSMFGQLLGVWVAGKIRRRFVTARGHVVDSGVGSGLGVAAVLMVSWMVAVPLQSSPYPSLATEATQSSIIRAVNSVMPNDVRSLYGSLREFLDRSGFPPVFGELPPNVGADLAQPDTTLSPAVTAMVRHAHGSVVSIDGAALVCSREIRGSGFVYAPQHVVTNAHVVAGTNEVSVRSGNRTLGATVVLFNPERDIAVLYVPGLDAPALPLTTSPATYDTPAVVLGYPVDSTTTSGPFPFRVRGARVGNRTTITGHDIYGNGVVRREIYAIRATVRSGNSGGPLVGYDGSVLGLVFATSTQSSDTGYVLTDTEIRPSLDQARTAEVPVPTAGCAAD